MDSWSEADNDVLNKAHLPPFTSWPVPVQERVRDNDALARGVRFRDDIQKLRHGGVRLAAVPPLPSAVEIGSQDVLACMWYRAFLDAERYTSSHKKRIVVGEHLDTHDDYRQEWWSLAGQLTSHETDRKGYLSVVFHRYTDTPQSEWTKDADAYSHLRITVQIRFGEDTQVLGPYSMPVWVPGVSCRFGQLTFGDVVSLVKNDTGVQEFPAKLVLGEGSFRLTSKAPVRMPASSGCVRCVDRYGWKRYDFPEVVGTGRFQGEECTFEGFFSHSWENGIEVWGVSRSIISRALFNLAPTSIANDYMDLTLKTTEGDFEHFFIVNPRSKPVVMFNAKTSRWKNPTFRLTDNVLLLTEKGRSYAISLGETKISMFGRGEICYTDTEVTFSGTSQGFGRLVMPPKRTMQELSSDAGEVLGFSDQTNMTRELESHQLMGESFAFTITPILLFMTIFIVIFMVYWAVRRRRAETGPLPKFIST